MADIVVLTTFERYLNGGSLEPTILVEFEETPIPNITEYIDYLVNDRFLKHHKIQHGVNLKLTDEELSLRGNSVNIKMEGSKAPFYIDVGHARKENDIYVLDKLFQSTDYPLPKDYPLPYYPLTNNQIAIGFSMASLMYHYAIRVQNKHSLENK